MDKEYIEINKETFPTPHRKVLNDFMRGWNACLNSVLQHRKADAAEVRHAYWIEDDREATCSDCKCRTFNWAAWSFDYCPFCGAKMDGKGEQIMARFCPYRKITTAETKPCYNADGERGTTTTTTESFAICDEGACVAWDFGVCTLVEDGRKG